VFAVGQTSPGVTIRECRPEEAEAVLLLWRQSGATPSATDNAEHLRRAIAASPALVLVGVWALQRVNTSTR
jgi:hypothetical protein